MSQTAEVSKKPTHRLRLLLLVAVVLAAAIAGAVILLLASYGPLPSSPYLIVGLVLMGYGAAGILGLTIYQAFRAEIASSHPRVQAVAEALGAPTDGTADD